VAEAKSSFPRNVACLTTHQLANRGMGSVMMDYRQGGRDFRQVLAAKRGGNH